MRRPCPAPEDIAARAGRPPADWPADGLEDVGRCPVCGGHRRAQLHGGLQDRTFGSAPGSWRLVRCGDCESAYLDPRPTRASIGLAYRDYYTHLEDPGAADAATGVRAALANGELNARWGYSATPALRAGRLLGRLLPTRAALTGRSVRHLHAQPGGQLLDIGSGSGSFVAQMARLGWRAEGLELDPGGVAVGRAAGLTITQGSAEDLEAGTLAEHFDAVTMNHVVEHLHEPEQALRRVAAVLRPGGTLWIATPNLRSLGHRHYGRDWLALDPPRHLVLFHRASLEALLRRCGLDVMPAPRATPDAALTFPQSAAIRDGRHMASGPARRPWATRARAAVAGVLAGHAEHLAEELVVIARRPNAQA
jgi:SAM-dependent methyltransferase